MIDNGTIIAKGIYKHPQADNFISVKQYMFVYRNGQKHLILRYTNDLNANIDSMKFVLTEINSDGEVIAVRKIAQSGIRVDMGVTFAPDSGIPISDECMDFKIEFLEATSDVYTYRKRGRRGNVYYTPRRTSRKRPPIGTSPITAKRMRKPSARGSAWLILLLVSIFLSVSVLVSYLVYIEDYNRRKTSRKDDTAYVYEIEEYSAY